jgi:hypothetical protein
LSEKPFCRILGGFERALFSGGIMRKCDRLLLFYGVFEGVLEKVAAKMWFYGGKNMVKCVVNVVTGRLLIRS